MLARAQRKRSHREPIERRWLRVVCSLHLPDEHELIRLKEFQKHQAWFREQLRLKNLDDA